MNPTAKRQRIFQGTGKQHLGRLPEPLLDTGRSRDIERRLALCYVHGMQHPPDEAAEMIAVQVRNQDGADCPGIKACALMADQRRGAAVDQERASTLRFDMQAGLQAPAGAERIAAANNGQFHSPTSRRALAALPFHDSAKLTQPINLGCYRRNTPRFNPGSIAIGTWG